MTLMTREILEQARSTMGSFSRAQYDLMGVETRPPPDLPQRIFVPKKWWLKVIGRDYPDETIAELIKLKDAHLTPRLIKNQMNARLRKAERQAKFKAEAEALNETLRASPLPDGMYDVEERGRREVWEYGRVIKWVVKRNVKNWGACPPPPRGETA